MSELVRHRDLNKRDARAITARIKSRMADLIEEVARAWIGRVWIALGYASWPDYIAGEFDRAPIHLPRDERRAVVELLRGQGMSARAIAPAIGVDHVTVSRDISPVANETPVDEVVPVTGLDGKTYPKRKPPKPPKPENVAARKARDDADAELTDQERARRDKEADAYPHEIGDQAMASFSGVIVRNVISCLDELVEYVRTLVEHGGVATGDDLRSIEAAHASYVAELDVLRMSELGEGA